MQSSCPRTAVKGGSPSGDGVGSCVVLEYLFLVSLQALEVTPWLAVTGRQTLLLTALLPYLIATLWLISSRQRDLKPLGSSRSLLPIRFVLIGPSLQTGWAQ